MKKRKGILLSCILSLPMYIFCQNTLSISNAFALIDQFHPIAKQAGLKIDQSKAGVLSARGSFDPSFYLNNNQKTFDGKNYFYYSNPELKIPTWYGIELKAGYENNYGEQISNEVSLGKSSYLGVSIPLLKDLLLDKRRADLAQSKIIVNLTEADRQIILNDLFLDGASTYWYWTFAYQKQLLFTDALTKSKDRLSLIKQSFQLGDKAAMDTVEGALQFQNIAQLQTQAFLDLQEEQRKLSNFLWDKNETPFNLDETVIPDSNWTKIDIEKVPLPLLSEIIDEANQLHPKLKSLGYKLDILAIDKKYKTQNLLPSFRVNYNFLNKGYEMINPINDRLYNNNYKAGLQFGLPLFLRQARGELKQTNLKIEQQEWETRQTRLEIENKIKYYFAELVALKKQHALNSASVQNAKQLLDAELQRYEVGESSLFLVNTRELKYIELLIKFYEVKAKFYKSIVALNWAKGKVY